MPAFSRARLTKINARRPICRRLVPELEILEDRTAPALVAAYSFDAGSGTTLADLSGNGNNGAISGATWSTSGKYGKALSFDPETLARLASLVSAWEYKDSNDTMERHFHDAGFDLKHPKIRKFFELCIQVQDLPRHLGQHSGGLVVCQGQLDSVVPLEQATMPNRVVVQWDKEDCADMGIVKVDLLGLGMMSVLQDALELVNKSTVGAPAARAEGESASPETRGSGDANRRSQFAVRGLQGHLVAPT